MKPKHQIGDKITLTSDAIENYGEKYAGKKFTVSHVATQYMPAAQFYANGSPSGFHPGFDDSTNCALYDCKELNFSVYEWEIA